MIPYRLDYTVEKILKDKSINARKLLKTLTGKSLAKKEAENVWLEVQDHKWLVSKRLGRDIGLRVAAIDYVENFHHSKKFYGNFMEKILYLRSSIV